MLTVKQSDDRYKLEITCSKGHGENCFCDVIDCSEEDPPESLWSFDSEMYARHDEWWENLEEFGGEA